MYPCDCARGRGEGLAGGAACTVARGSGYRQNRDVPLNPDACVLNVRLQVHKYRVMRLAACHPQRFPNRAHRL